MRRSLVLLHRWLGIAGNLLFVVWFASALVMMYARMPALDPGDRLNRLPALDLDAIRIDPAQAAAAARLGAGGEVALRIRLGMAGERPIYRLRTAAGWTAVYADTGSPMLQLSESQAAAIATQFARPPAGEVTPQELHYDRLLPRPDQWTLELPTLFPLHRIRSGSDVLYVSDRTADVVMETTATSRFWGTSGAVFHWHAGRTTSQGQHAAVAGGGMRLNDLDLTSIRTSLESLPGEFTPREVEFLAFDGEPMLLAYRPPFPSDDNRYRGGSYGGGPSAFQATVQPFEHRLTVLGSGETRRFARDELLAAATAAMPGAEVVAAEELAEYDAYYGDRRRRSAPLPVLRVRFDDADRTWLYLDPALGRIVHREQRRSRVDRWLYRGLHRLDFPGFYHRRPLWDVVVIVLLLGGLFSTASSLAPAAKRLRRTFRRLAARLRRKQLQKG